VNWLLVLVGGMAGAPLRYLTDRAVRARHDSVFPWGTFAVNVAGCALIGLLTAVTAEARLLLATGLCGALTTYSTFSYETLRLAEARARLLAAANVAATVVAGLAATLAGTAVAEAAWA
jgi:CrcB protein